MTDRLSHLEEVLMLGISACGEGLVDHEARVAAREAALDLLAVARAARDVMRPDVIIGGAPYHGPDIFGNDSTVWAGLREALARLEAGRWVTTATCAEASLRSALDSMREELREAQAVGLEWAQTAQKDAARADSMREERNSLERQLEATDGWFLAQRKLRLEAEAQLAALREAASAFDAAYQMALGSASAFDILNRDEKQKELRALLSEATDA